MSAIAAPLLAVDAPSLLYRAFFALPGSITDGDGHPVNALLGCANLVLRAVERHDAARRRAVLRRRGGGVPRGAARRPTTPTGPPMPDELARQWARRARVLRARSAGRCSTHGDARGRRPARQPRAGRGRGRRQRAALHRRPRHVPVRRRATSPCCSRGGKGGPELVDEAGVRERYGIEPEQVPDFIALRGDPSDGIPGAKGIGEKTARDLLREYGTLDAAIENAAASAPARARRAARPGRRAARVSPHGDAAAGAGRAARGPPDRLRRRGRRRRGTRHAPARGAAARPHAVICGRIRW